MDGAPESGSTSHPGIEKWNDVRYQPFNRKKARKACPPINVADLDGISPHGGVTGRILGQQFQAAEATFKDGILNLREHDGTHKFPLREASFIVLDRDQITEGNTIHIPLETPDEERVVNVHLGFINSKTQTPDSVITNKFSLWLRFERIDPEFIHGRIYACVPGSHRTKISGGFRARQVNH